VEHGQVVRRRGVYHVQTMILQICADYSGLPDVRGLELYEIMFFYYGLQSSLIKLTKPSKNG